MIKQWRSKALRNRSSALRIFGAQLYVRQWLQTLYRTQNRLIYRLADMCTSVAIWLEQAIIIIFKLTCSHWRYLLPSQSYTCFSSQYWIVTSGRGRNILFHKTWKPKVRRTHDLQRDRREAQHSYNMGASYRTSQLWSLLYLFYIRKSRSNPTFLMEIIESWPLEHWAIQFKFSVTLSCGSRYCK